MNLQEFQTIFKEECIKNNIKYDESNAKMLYYNMKLILEWNEKINLTAIKEENEFVVKHYVDSLSVNDFVNHAERVLDIGTGAGFPGVPLKIYHPEIDFTLIDSVNKKINVVNDIIDKLDLAKIEALHIRAEDLAKDNNYREQFDIVITRAVSSLTTIVEYMLPFVKIGGKALCMKGPNLEQELIDSKKAIKVLGGEIEEIKKSKIRSN